MRGETQYSCLRNCLPACVFHLVLTSMGLGQSVDLQIGSTTLEVGESVDAQLICTNTEEPTLPEFPAPDGLELKLSNPSPSVSQNLQIINGRSSRTVTYTYSLRLTAVKEGTYRLGPLLVAAGGQTFQTKPVDVSVRKGAVATGSNGDRILWAEIQVQPQSVYVTQTYRATLTIGIRKVEIGGTVYSFERLLQKTIDSRATDLSVFAQGQATLSDITLADAAGKRRPYEVYRIVQDIRAEEVGEVAVGPVFLKVNYPTSLQRGWFGDLEVASSRRESARTEALTVTVKGPPMQGRPADFAGAIGQFTMSVAAKPEQVEQGQPITLTIALRGNPLQGVAAPKLETQAELASRFDFSHEELVGDTEQGAKVFRRAIFPKTAGEQTIPPIRWAYFDPQREQYVTLFSEPVRIVVDPPSGRPGSPSSLEANSPPEEATKLTVLTGGISPNYVDVSMVLANQTVSWSGVHWGLLGAAPLACMAITMSRRHRARMATDVSWARRRSARREALHRASRAERSVNTQERLSEYAAALTQYLADRFNMPGASMTSMEARNLLAVHGVDSALMNEIAQFLELCDASRYASGAIASDAASKAAGDLRRWLDQLERAGS